MNWTLLMFAVFLNGSDVDVKHAAYDFNTRVECLKKMYWVREQNDREILYSGKPWIVAICKEKSGRI